MQNTNELTYEDFLNLPTRQREVIEDFYGLQEEGNSPISQATYLDNQESIINMVFVMKNSGFFSDRF